MKEPWSTRWYTPLVVLSGGVLVLLVLALALVEVLLAEAPRVPAPASWTTPLQRSDEALREGDIAEALTWWREAQVVALRSRQWEGMLEVGDAARRLGAQAGLRHDGDALARSAYMTGLVRARRQGSLDGMLRAAVRFGELGDREVVAHVVRLAERQAGDDPRAREQLQAIAERWLAPPREAGTPSSSSGGVLR